MFLVTEEKGHGFGFFFLFIHEKKKIANRVWSTTSISSCDFCSRRTYEWDSERLPSCCLPKTDLASPEKRNTDNTLGRRGSEHILRRSVSRLRHDRRFGPNNGLSRALFSEPGDAEMHPWPPTTRCQSLSLLPGIVTTKNLSTCRPTSPGGETALGYNHWLNWRKIYWEHPCFFFLMIKS